MDHSNYGSLDNPYKKIEGILLVFVEKLDILIIFSNSLDPD